jgi:[acyl-carrier-protein] S-malonyltransferase
MTRAIVFPGQGSQSPGMGQELAAAFPEARAVFDEVDEALGEKLSDLIFDGPEDRLTLTENAQPALMAVSMAVVRVLEAKAGKPLGELCACVAGHSLGEYSALCAAGTFSLADTARLLRRRGLAMQRAVPVGAGAMAAVLGLELGDVEWVAGEAAQGEVCQVANDNANGQVVVSGDKAAVERAVALATERGARKSMLLSVSAPFHCALMQPAADEMAAALSEVEMNDPTVPLIANVSADAVQDSETIRKLLVEQVTGMVRWRESVLRMKSRGVDTLYEAGAGKVLATMTKRIDRELSQAQLNTAEDVDAFVAAL